MSNRLQPARFLLGTIVATPGALDACRRAKVEVKGLIQRHHNCDWGTADAEANEAGLDGSDMLISIFDVGGVEVWVLTEADRSATTVLLPSER